MFLHYLMLCAQISAPVPDPVSAPGTNEPAPPPTMPFPRDPEPYWTPPLPPKPSAAPQVLDIWARVIDNGECAIGDTTPVRAARIGVDWAVTQPDDAHYTTHLYENYAEVATMPSSATGYDNELVGFVVNGLRARQMRYEYRVDVVNNATGQVVSSASTSVFVALGTCGR